MFNIDVGTGGSRFDQGFPWAQSCLPLGSGFACAAEKAVHVRSDRWWRQEVDDMGRNHRGLDDQFSRPSRTIWSIDGD